MAHVRPAAVVLLLLVSSFMGLEPRASQPGAMATGAKRSAFQFPAGRFADLPGVRLWYTDTGGNGEAVVLLHANTGNSESWEPQVETLSEAGYRVIAFDRRGWGKTVPVPESGPQPGLATDDLHALVDAIGLSTFHLIGVAGGGFVAMDYAAWHGDRLLTMVIAASTGAIGDPEIVDFINRIAIPGIRSLPAHYREVGASYRGENPEGLQRWIEMEEHARQPGAPPLGSGGAVPLRSPNTFAKLATIQVRTLVMAGDADLLAPPGLMKVWAPYLKNAEWTVVHDAGHAIPWERPNEFNADVIRFLKGHRFETVARHTPKAP